MRLQILGMEHYSFWYQSVDYELIRTKVAQLFKQFSKHKTDKILSLTSKSLNCNCIVLVVSDTVFICIDFYYSILIVHDIDK